MVHGGGGVGNERVGRRDCDSFLAEEMTTSARQLLEAIKRKLGEAPRRIVRIVPPGADAFLGEVYSCELADGRKVVVKPTVRDYPSNDVLAVDIVE